MFKPVQPVEHDAKFQMPPPRPNCDNFEDVVMALTRVYLPDRYVLKVFGNTLTYIQKRHLRPQRTFKIVPRDILHLFAMITTWAIAVYRASRTTGVKVTTFVVTTPYAVRLA